MIEALTILGIIAAICFILWALRCAAEGTTHL